MEKTTNSQKLFSQVYHLLLELNLKSIPLSDNRKMLVLTTTEKLVGSENGIIENTLTIDLDSEINEASLLVQVKLTTSCLGESHTSQSNFGIVTHGEMIQVMREIMTIIKQLKIRSARYA